MWTTGEYEHRQACEGTGHKRCRSGPLWRCRGCRRRFCMEDGAADAYPDLCDECWAEQPRLVPPAPAQAQEELGL